MATQRSFTSQRRFRKRNDFGILPFLYGSRDKRYRVSDEGNYI
ncbi:unnamed protein product [Larinioides sclopetarius]